MNQTETIHRSKDQAESLRNLVGSRNIKISERKSESIKHLSRVRKLVNCIRDERVEIASTRTRIGYLLNQISERDLMLEDCYETMLKTQKMVSEMESHINRLEYENERLRSFKGLEVVA